MCVDGEVDTQAPPYLQGFLNVYMVSGCWGKGSRVWHGARGLHYLVRKSSYITSLRGVHFPAISGGLQMGKLQASQALVATQVEPS